MQELKVEFDKVDSNGLDKPRQTRFLRSQQDLKERIQETTGPEAVPIDNVSLESKVLFFLFFEISSSVFSARRS